MSNYYFPLTELFSDENIIKCTLLRKSEQIRCRHTETYVFLQFHDSFQYLNNEIQFSNYPVTCIGYNTDIIRTWYQGWISGLLSWQKKSVNVNQRTSCPLTVADAVEKSDLRPQYVPPI